MLHVYRHVLLIQSISEVFHDLWQPHTGKYYKPAIPLSLLGS